MRQEQHRALMTGTRDDEWRVLREERDRLAAEGAKLKAEMARLQASPDADALRALKERLIRHADALHAFHDALEAFHQQFGPLGPLVNLVYSAIGLTGVP